MLINMAARMFLPIVFAGMVLPMAAIAAQNDSSSIKPKSMQAQYSYTVPEQSGGINATCVNHRTQTAVIVRNNGLTIANDTAGNLCDKKFPIIAGVFMTAGSYGYKIPLVDVPVGVGQVMEVTVRCCMPKQEWTDVSAKKK